MKKETGKKSKLWLWIVIAVAALAIIGGVVAAFVLPGLFQTEVPSGPVPEAKLYWNMDRELWQEEGTGMSLRKPSEDGYYHISYLVDGKIEDIKVSDKQLVNYLDGQDLLCLAFDEAGICVDAAPFDTYFQEVGKNLYVKRFLNGTLEMNSSIGMDGMNMQQVIPEGFHISEVTVGAENKGQSITPDWLDACSIYTDQEGNLAAVYITSHNAIEAEVAWVINTMNSRGVHTQPDENGIYTLDFAIDGKIQQRKSRDWNIVKAIETAGSWDCSMALEYDEEGYIIDYETVQMAIRGVKLYSEAIVENVDGNHITGNTAQGVPVDFMLDEDCVIYNVCNGNCFHENEGEQVDEIYVGDRLHVYTDLDGKTILIFKVVSHIDGPLYYKLSKTTNEDGYFVYQFSVDGKLKTYKTKDEKIAAKVDSQSTNIVALEVSGSIIKKVGGYVCVTNGYRRANGSYVTSAQAPVLTWINYSDPTNMVAKLMNADCKVYLVDNNYKTKMGSITEVKQYDRIVALGNANDELIYVYVTQRYKPGHKLAVNLSRQYAAGETTRVPDAEGYYVFDIICEGKQMQVKTKDKDMASFIDLQNYPMFGFKQKNGILTSVCTAVSVFPYAMKSNNFGRVESTENGILTTWYSNTGMDKVISGHQFNLTSKTKIYNMTTDAYSKYQGEKTKLKKYDHVQGMISAETRELKYVFVMDRPLATTKMYANVASVPPIDTVPNRTPDKNGYYTLKLFSDGKIITVRVQDPALCANIDAIGNTIPFGLTFKKGTNIVTGFYKAADTQYFQTVGPVDVVATAEETFTVRYPSKTTDYVINRAGLKVIDLRAESKTRGKSVSLKKGMRVRVYNDGEVGYVFVLDLPDTTPGTELKLDSKGYGDCPICGKVKWTAYDGSKQYLDITDHQHFYLVCDTDMTHNSANAMTIKENGKVCFHLNGCKLTTNGGRFWLTAASTEEAGFNLFGTNGEIVFTTRSPIQQNRGEVNVYGGTYTPAGSYRPFIDCAVRRVVIKDATIHASLRSQSTATHFVLQGSTIAHKINIDLGGIVEFDSAWTGTAIMDMQAADLTDGKIPTGKAFYNGEAPTGKVTLASGEELQFKNGGLEIKYPEELKLDANKQAECPVCKKKVTWEAFDGAKQYTDITTHRHFYLTKDTEYTASDANMLTIAAGGKVCFHLNSYTLTANKGRFVMTDATTSDSALNIITTNGKLYYSGSDALIQQNKGKVTVSGGTYSATGSAPFITATGSVVLKNAVVKADIVTQSAAAAIELQGAAKTNKINLDNGGKVKLNSNWTGSALLDMKASELVGGKVPTDKVYYTGKAPTGKMKLATGQMLTYKDGGLIIDTSIKEELIVDEEGFGVCPACEENVKWTVFDGTRQFAGIAEHMHFYLTDDVTYDGTTISANMIQIGAGGSACFHLNGKTLTVKDARFWMTGGAEEEAVLNIFGNNGKINYSDRALIQQNKGTVTVDGGTYTPENTENFVNLATRTFTIKDATVKGNFTSQSGATRLVLEGSTTIGMINFDLGGKLELNSNWTGTATLDMTAEELGSEPAPATYTGEAPTGTVKLASGQTLIYKNGTLVLAEPVVPPYTAECPACGVVEWTKYDGSKQYTGISTHRHFYLAADSEYTFNSANMMTIGEGGSVCFDLNGKTLNVNNGRIWLTGSAAEDAVLNIFGTGATVNYTDRPFIQQNRGAVNIIGGTYNATNTEYFVEIATRNFTIKDATISGNLKSASGATRFILEGATTVGKINLTGGGALELKSNWTGSAILDMDSLELSNGKVPTEKAFYTGTAPTGTVTLASGETLIYKDGGLELDEQDQPVTPPQPEQPFDKDCPVCGEVEWTKYDGTQQYTGISTHKHFYLAADTSYTFDSVNLMTIGAGGSVCFDLNGKTLTVERVGGARIWLTSGAAESAVLNIFANGGAVNYRDYPLIQQNRGAVNIIGGTYTATGTTSFVDTATRSFTIKDATINANLTSQSGATRFVLEGATSVGKINLAGGGKLELKSDWTGSATLDMQAADLTGGMVSTEKAFYTGAAPTGTVQLASGETLKYVDGALVLDQDEPVTPPQPSDDVLIVDENGYGECPACGNVKWTAYDGTVQYTGITTHQHFYLTADTSYTFDSINMITVGAGGSVCFHLNGKTLTVERVGGARIWLTGNVGEDAVLNIFGTDGGAVNYRDYNLIQQNRGTVNIIGGTYTATGTNDFVTTATRLFTIQDATINGNLTSQSSATRFVLEGATSVGKISLAGGGKVELKSDWTGSAVLDMTSASLTDGKVPTTQVFYTGEAPTGTVTLASGETLIYKDGGLEIGVPSVIPADAQAKIDAAAVISAMDPAQVIAGTTCPMCGETVAEWKKVTGRTNVAGNAHDHYYLTGTVNSTGYWTIQPGQNSQVCVVLVDANVTSSGPFIFGDKAGATVNIMGTGTVTMNGGNLGYGVNADIFLGSSVTVNLYGGTYIHTPTVDNREVGAVSLNHKDAVLNMFDGAIIGRAAQDKNTVSRNVYVAKAGTFNMYGGIIRNGNSKYGGNVDLRDSGHLNMYGGSIENGYSSARGGNIYASYYNGSTTYSVINMYAGSITGGEATVYGGNIDLETGSINVFGGTISGGVAGDKGGNIYYGTSGVLNTISGGTITTGTATSGGNLYVYKGDFQVTGGTIENGSLDICVAATIQDATINGDVDLTTGNSVVTLKGNTNITGNINFKDSYNSSKVIVDTTFTGTVNLNENDGMYLNGVFDVTRGTATGDFTGTVKVTGGETLKHSDGKLVKAS